MTHRLVPDNPLEQYDQFMTSSPYQMDIHMTLPTPFSPMWTCIKLACRFTEMWFFWHFNSLPKFSPNSQVFYLILLHCRKDLSSQLHLTCSQLLSIVYVSLNNYYYP